MKYHRQYHQVIDGWQRGSLLPFVDSLRRGEAKDILQLFNRQAILLSQPDNIFPCIDHVDGRHLIHFLLLFWQKTRTEALVCRLKIINVFLL